MISKGDAFLRGSLAFASARLEIERLEHGLRESKVSVAPRAAEQKRRTLTTRLMICKKQRM